MDVVPYRVGVPKSRQSGLEKFEGPDPNEWCLRGYAIVDPNSRGSFDSEGDLYFLGPKDGIVTAFSLLMSQRKIVMISLRKWRHMNGVTVLSGWLGTPGLELFSTMLRWLNHPV